MFNFFPFKPSQNQNFQRTMWRVVDIIKTSSEFLQKKGVPDPRLDAELLLGHVLQKNRLELYMFFDRPMTAPELDQYRELVKRRGDREPLQHIVGSTGFMNAEIKTGPQALVPRPETEVLVETLMERSIPPESRVLDIGTGSGCIAISIAQELDQPKVLAIDVSPDALALAKENAGSNEVSISFQRVDILQDLPKMNDRFDIVVSNPPYIRQDEREDLQEEVREHDPALALFDDGDGLTFYRRFADVLPDLLRPGGQFLFEFGGKPQAEYVLDIFTRSVYSDLEIIQDHNGDPRLISGRFKP